MGMAKLFDAASNLDFDGWFRGLASAGISGSASAISGAIVLPSLDSVQFNIFKPHFWIAVLAIGGSSGLVSLMKFLSTEPIPLMKKVTTTTETVTGVAAKPIITKTVEEVRVEPVKLDLPVDPKVSVK